MRIHRRMAEGIRGQIEEDLRHVKMKKLREKLGGSHEDEAFHHLTGLTLAEDITLTLPSAPAPFLKLELMKSGDLTGGTLVTESKNFSPHFKAKGTLHEGRLHGGKKLTRENAVKDTFQVTLSIAKSSAEEMSLEPGDALDLICGNPEAEGTIPLHC